MNEIQLILQLFIAHLLADFIFQPQSWSNKKEKRVLTIHHVYHALVVGSLSYILAFDLGFWKAAVILLLLHLMTDMLKSGLILHDKSRSFFFFDQVLHLLLIIGVAYVYSYFSGIDFFIRVELNTIAIVSGFILCTKPANVIIKHLLKAFSIEMPVESEGTTGQLSLPNAGKLIGIAERLLALALIVMGEFEAVGLIIAAKSILRFGGTKHSEYVLVGTLLSFGIAVFTGILISLMF